MIRSITSPVLCDYGFRARAEPVIGPATSGRTRWRAPE